MKTIEEQAREYASQIHPCKWKAIDYDKEQPIRWREVKDAFLAAAAPREELIAELVGAAGISGFLGDALEVADHEGMPDSTEIPVWPKDMACPGRPLTVGALRKLSAALAKAEARQ